MEPADFWIVCFWIVCFFAVSISQKLKPDHTSVGLQSQGSTLESKNTSLLPAPTSSFAVLSEGSTHVMTVCCSDVKSAKFLGAPVLYINGPSTFCGSPEYTQ